MKIEKIYLLIFLAINLNLLSIKQVNADPINKQNLLVPTTNSERLIIPQEEVKEKDFSVQPLPLEQDAEKQQQTQQYQQYIDEQLQEQQYDNSNEFKDLAPD